MRGRLSPTSRAQRAPLISWPDACPLFLPLCHPSRKMPRKTPRRRPPRRGPPRQLPQARMPSPKPRPQKPPPAAARPLCEKRRHPRPLPELLPELAPGLPPGPLQPQPEPPPELRLRKLLPSPRSRRSNPNRNPPCRIVRNNVAITYTSGEQVEVYRCVSNGHVIADYP